MSMHNSFFGITEEGTRPTVEIIKKKRPIVDVWLLNSFYN